MKDNLMNRALEFIENHFELNYTKMMAEIEKITKRKRAEFAKTFAMMTNGDSLTRYVDERRIYKVCLALRDKPDYDLATLAQDYGYSSQQEMCNKFNDYAQFTPKSVIIEGNMFPDNRISFEVITAGDTLQSSNKEETTMSQEVAASTPTYEIEPPEMFFEAMNDFGYSMDTCHKIAELAECLGIPFYALAEGCFDTMIDIRSAADFIEPDIERAIDLGISSYKELDSICSYFECKYYELDSTMVDIYRRCHRNNEEV